MHGSVNGKASATKPLNLGNRSDFFGSCGFAIATGGPRPRHFAGQRISRPNQPTEAPAEEGGAGRGLKFGNWLGLAARIAAIALLLEACAMWWSRCSRLILAMASAPLGGFVGPAVALAAPDRPAAQPEWPAGAFCWCWLVTVLIPLRRPVRLSDHQKKVPGSGGAVLEMGRGALSMAPDALRQFSAPPWIWLACSKLCGQQ